jgi:hypothetical protein
LFTTRDVASDSSVPISENTVNQTAGSEVPNTVGKVKSNAVRAAPHSVYNGNVFDFEPTGVK